jgi:L-lactate dehydrogenase complex protein LldF
VKIEIPKLLLRLRSEVTDAQQRQGVGGLERLAFGVFAWVMTHPKIYRLAGRLGAKLAPVVPPIGPLKKWAGQRTLPRPAKRSFHQLWAERKRP